MQVLVQLANDSQQQIDAAVATLVLAKIISSAASTSSFTKLGRQGVLDPVAEHRGLRSERDEQVGLARAGIPDQAQRQTLGHPFALGQGVDRGGVVLGLDSKSKDRTDFSRGNFAALMRRSDKGNSSAQVVIRRLLLAGRHEVVCRRLRTLDLGRASRDLVPGVLVRLVLARAVHAGVLDRDAGAGSGRDADIRLRQRGSTGSTAGSALTPTT